MDFLTLKRGKCYTVLNIPNKLVLAAVLLLVFGKCIAEVRTCDYLNQGVILSATGPHLQIPHYYFKLGDSTFCHILVTLPYRNTYFAIFTVPQNEL
jgi:hypothetical protein